MCESARIHAFMPRVAEDRIVSNSWQDGCLRRSLDGYITAIA